MIRACYGRSDRDLGPDPLFSIKIRVLCGLRVDTFSLGSRSFEK